MTNKVILVVLDGLNFQVARDCMGYLQGLNEAGQASLFSLQSELPSMSRPLYECILTGKRPVESGIVHNDVVRLSNHSSIFSLAVEAGLTTAAAAYYWVSELYNRAPYNAVRDRFTEDKSQNIQHGCFYHTDHYPDEHLFIDAETLRWKHDPDFLLIHPMNIDDAGHKAGVDSSQYRNAARQADICLSMFMPKWLEQGYQVIITSDHGMNADHSHGGVLEEERMVPMFIAGDAFAPKAVSGQVKSPLQREVCGTVCHLLGIKQHNKPMSADLLADSVLEYTT